MEAFGAHPDLFGPFYALAFLVSYLVAAWVGYRRGWPPAAWLLVLLAAGIGGLVGTRLLPLGVEGLRALLVDGALPETPAKRIPGTVAGALLLAVGARWALGLRRSIFDPFAYAGLAMLIVARVGCLLAGCCFGTPTDLPWGVTYAPGSFAHGFHLAHGVAEAGALAPHPVHPIPLYDIAFALVGLALLPRLSRMLKAPGSLCWATVGGYAVYRFAQDFVRANEVTAIGGLTTIQLVCAVAAVLALGWVAWRERAPVRDEAEVEEPGVARLGAVFAGLVLVRIGLEGWLTEPEEALVFVRMLPAGAALAVVAWRRSAAAQVRWAATLAAAGLPLVLGFQLAPADSSGEFSYWAVDAHAATGQYEEVDICSSDLFQYRTAGLAVANVTVDPEGEFSRELGLRVYGGTQETVQEAPIYPPGGGAATGFAPREGRSTVAVAPYAQVEGKYLGGHLGFQVGSVPFLHEEENAGFLPSAGLRVGPRAGHLHVGFLDGAQFGSPAPGLRVGLGTGRLTADGHEMRVQGGVSGSGFYGMATLPVDRFLVEPMAAIASTTGGTAFHTGLRVRYTFSDDPARPRVPFAPPGPAVPPAPPDTTAQ